MAQLSPEIVRVYMRRYLFGYYVNYEENMRFLLISRKFLSLLCEDRWNLRIQIINGWMQLYCLTNDRICCRVIPLNRRIVRLLALSIKPEDCPANIRPKYEINLYCYRRLTRISKSARNWKVLLTAIRGVNGDVKLNFDADCLTLPMTWMTIDLLRDNITHITGCDQLTPLLWALPRLESFEDFGCIPKFLRPTDSIPHRVPILPSAILRIPAQSITMIDETFRGIAEFPERYIPHPKLQHITVILNSLMEITIDEFRKAFFALKPLGIPLTLNSDSIIVEDDLDKMANQSCEQFSKLRAIADMAAECGFPLPTLCGTLTFRWPDNKRGRWPCEDRERVLNELERRTGFQNVDKILRANETRADVEISLVVRLE